jgi:hypothetical protein
MHADSETPRSNEIVGFDSVEAIWLFSSAAACDGSEARGCGSKDVRSSARVFSDRPIF